MQSVVDSRYPLPAIHPPGICVRNLIFLFYLIDYLALSSKCVCAYTCKIRRGSCCRKYCRDPHFHMSCYQTSVYKGAWHLTFIMLSLSWRSCLLPNFRCSRFCSEPVIDCDYCIWTSSTKPSAKPDLNLTRLPVNGAVRNRRVLNLTNYSFSCTSEILTKAQKSLSRFGTFQFNALQTEQSHLPSVQRSTEYHLTDIYKACEKNWYFHSIFMHYLAGRVAGSRFCSGLYGFGPAGVRK